MSANLAGNIGRAVCGGRGRNVIGNGLLTTFVSLDVAHRMPLHLYTSFAEGSALCRNVTQMRR